MIKNKKKANKRTKELKSFRRKKEKKTAGESERWEVSGWNQKRRSRREKITTGNALDPRKKWAREPQPKNSRKTISKIKNRDASLDGEPSQKKFEIKIARAPWDGSDGKLLESSGKVSIHVTIQAPGFPSGF